MRTATSLLTLLLPLLALADPHAHDARLHRRHKQRADVSRLDSRGFRATFYDVGLGACGKTNVESEHVIALNVPQYAGGSHCFEMVTISYQGKTTQAQVVDECMGCPYGAIDMSRGLFDFFADESAGEISVDWSFGGGDPKPSSTKEKPKPSSTSWSSSSTWKPPKTTSTSTSATSTWSSSSSTSKSTSTPTPTPTSTATPTPTPTQTGPQNLLDLDSLVGVLGQLVLAAGQ